jgi:hypothetical protein
MTEHHQDILQRAEVWRDELTDMSNGWGDGWQPNYTPAEFTEHGHDEYNGTIHVNENIDPETQGFNYPMAVPDDENFAVLICHLYNDGWSIVDALLDEVSRLRDENEHLEAQVDMLEQEAENCD